jgi:hypothetical protein
MTYKGVNILRQPSYILNLAPPNLLIQRRLSYILIYIIYICMIYIVYCIVQDTRHTRVESQTKNDVIAYQLL